MGFNEMHVYSTLMGMRECDIDQVRDCKPDVWRVHVPDVEFFTVPDDAWIHCHETFLKTGIGATYMTMGILSGKIDEYLHEKRIQVEYPDMLSRGGNLWKGREIKGPLRCTMDRWDKNVILPDGSVWLCCQDYSCTSGLGNLNALEYDDITRAGERFRLSALAGNTPEICRFCSWGVSA
jgi:hypothetical protein